MAGNFKRADVIRPCQIRMARAAVGLSVRALAEQAGVNKATIVRLEAGHNVRQATLDVIRQVLEHNGAEFLVNAEDGAIAVSVRADGNDHY